jgi:hypothetical protein
VRRQEGVARVVPLQDAGDDEPVRHPDLAELGAMELVVVTTVADKVLDRPLSEIGGKGRRGAPRAATGRRRAGRPAPGCRR